MKPLTAKETEDYLRRGGYVLDHIRGSHYIWIHPQTGRSVPVPHHGNHVIPQGTLQSIFNGAGIPKPQR